MAIPSVCPECGSMLEHYKPSPASIETPMEMSCPQCGYENTA